MDDCQVPSGVEEYHEAQLLLKGQQVLEESTLDITKRWLGQIIARIDDLTTLESFPTQESIRISVELIEGLAKGLSDQETLESFAPGGDLYEMAGALGSVGPKDADGLVHLEDTILELENAILALLQESLRREDAELLTLVIRLRLGLHGICASASETYFRRASGELDRLAHTDVLTGLFNRRYLLRELDRHVELYKRYHHPFSLLMIDLDNLKAVNDTFGHVAGDAALKHVATLMRDTVRDVDIPCRFGGDEFVILMPDTGEEAVEVVGDRLADSLSRTKLKVDSTLLTLQMSHGSATCPDDGVEAEELLQEADASLYRAKQRKHDKGQGVV